MNFVNGVGMGESKSTVPERAIREELSRILESSLFSQSDRLVMGSELVRQVNNRDGEEHIRLKGEWRDADSA